MDVAELAAYIETHPDEHEQRWRLARALYKSMDYSAALAHLRVLHEQWEPYIYVERYLGAALYRLGEYEQAASVIENALVLWPDEVSLRQQLARIYEKSGQMEKASAVWRTLYHSGQEGNDSAQSLESNEKLTPISGKSAGRDSALELGKSKDCVKCGAQNSEKRDVCWQCGAPFGIELTIDSDAPAADANPWPQWIWVLWGGLFMAALCTVGVYITLQNLFQALAPDGGEAIRRSTLDGLLAERLLAYRITAGVGLFFLWPWMLRRALRLLGAASVLRATINTTGLLLAAAAYAALWGPIRLLPIMALVLLASSFVLTAATLRITMKHAFMVWMAQCAVIPVWLVICLAGYEGVRPLLESPAIMRFAIHEHQRITPGYYAATRLYLPTTLRLTWASTGSSWLDAQAAPPTFEIITGMEMLPLTYVLDQDGGQTLMHDVVAGTPYRRTAGRIQPGAPYILAMNAPLPGNAIVACYSLLPLAMQLQ